jgi:hypothetical protein
MGDDSQMGARHCIPNNRACVRQGASNDWQRGYCKIPRKLAQQAS